MMIFSSYSYAITPKQIVELKKAGVSDEIIRIILEQDKLGTKVIKDKQGDVYIIYSTGNSVRKEKLDIKEEEKTKKAWEMLKNIIIDIRP